VSAFVGMNVEWETDAKARSVDGRTLPEIVAMTMMPGRTSRTAAKDFASIIGHFESNPTPAPQRQTTTAEEDNEEEAEEDDSEDDEQLLDQLGGKSRSVKRSRATSKRSTSSAPTTGFNPFVNARPPGGNK
jgi:hypothetical protein